MTTAMRPAVTGVPAGGRLTGTGTLIRLNLRRERIPLVAWVLGIALVAASTFSTIAALYPAEAERAALAQSIAVNPAFLAITGPITGTSVGAISTWRIMAVGTSLVALMAGSTLLGMASMLLGIMLSETRAVWRTMVDWTDDWRLQRTWTVFYLY